VRTRGATVLLMASLPITGWLFSALAGAQQSSATWQDEVRKCAELQDWSCALARVEPEVARAPKDMEVRAWRARVLLWSGKLAAAEAEYASILAAVPEDPDYWMGLSQVYSREGRAPEALQALDRAVQLDPNRADLRVARAIALRGLGAQYEAKLDLHRALQLDPMNTQGREVLRSLREEFRHELRVGVNTDLFNFADANQDEGLTLISRWTPRWTTTVAGGWYHWGDTDAEKFAASVTGKLPKLGALTVGGAAARDNGVVPRHEAFFDYDRGFKLRGKFLRGWEIVYGQHWFWYSTARILTLRESMMFYLPHDWTWSLGLTEARSQFSGTSREWRPSGHSRLGFPMAGWEPHRLSGNVFFGVGTENFAKADQIGEFSSQTYGGGLRFQFSNRQDLTGFAAYQKRTQGRTESSFGFTYGIRF
jgi:tetratricopeptide (TPR) repeat protein